jgi:RNA polymerase sigma-70 factor, ECF subfamily
MVDIQTDQRFSHIFSSFSEEIFRYIYYRTHDEDVANDIVQTVFARVYTNLKSIRPDTERAYIMTMAKNALTDYYRSNKHAVQLQDSLPSHDPIDPTSTPDQKVITKQDQQFVAQTLSIMNPSDAEIINLKALMDWSYSEIAEYLSESEQTIRKRYSRALARFAEIIHQTYH